MRACVIRVVMAGVVVLAGSSPSHALGWEWLDHLSGPGPWHALFYEQKIACSFEAPPPKTNADGTKARSVGGSGPCILPGRDKENRHWRKRLVAAGVGVRVAWTKQNDLPYPEGVTAQDQKVRQFHVYSFADVALPKHLRAIHVGGALGATRFWGRAIDEPLWRPTLEARLTVKLFRTLTTGSVDYRIGRRWFLGRLNAENFGAAGPFKVDDDGVWFTGFVFDFN